MFDKIFSLVKPDLALTHMQSLVNCIVNLIGHTKPDYLISADSKDQMIDFIINILQSQKGKK